MTTPIVSLLGLGIAVGILGLAWTFLVRPAPKGPDVDRGAVTERERFGRVGRVRIRRAVIPVSVGLVCIAITRWPVAGLIGGLGAATLPNSLRKVVPGEASKRTEAVASWTELIRDSLAASAGLAQSIVVTAPSAPILIRPQVGMLATRLTNGQTLEAGLHSFARDVDDPAAEFVVCALLLAATSRAQKLVEVLSSLTESIREDVSMRLRVDAGRASARSSVRTVVLFSVAFVCLLSILAHTYLIPFGTTVGQLVLAIVGLFYALGLTLMVRLVRPATEIRLLGEEPVA